MPFQKGHPYGKRFQKGNKVNLGKKNGLGSKHPHSEKTKIKISEKLKGRKLSLVKFKTK